MSSLDRRASVRQQARIDRAELFDGDLDSQPAAELLVRRWFAALAAIRSLQAESDLLLERLMLADAAWRHAHAQLSEFEAIRDGLEREMFGSVQASSGFQCADKRQPAATAVRSSETAHP